MNACGALAYRDGFSLGLRPDPLMTVTEWADEHRYLPKASSKEHGKYRSSRTPFFREIMDCLSPHMPIQEICLQKATQVGGTEVGNNWIGYVVDVAPGPMLMVLPTVELAKDHSKLKLAPTIECTPRLRGKIKENRSRDSGNTIQGKSFPGGMLFLVGSNSGAGFRHRSIRYLFLDDIDGYEADVGGEGDPIDLAKKRTDTYSSRKKIFEVSTPTVKGISRIEKSFEESDQRYYYVPCPHCGEYQRLEWGGQGSDFGIKFERNEYGNVEAVWYECRHCHDRVDESHKTAMLKAGRWVPTYPEREKRGYHLSGLYSPLGWVSWTQVVKEFLSAKDNRERLHDQVSRAYGILRSAQTITSEETMHLLSSVRMGINIGLVDGLEIPTVNELFIQTQPAHLQKLHKEQLESSERNVARASYLRRRLSDNGHEHN